MARRSPGVFLFAVIACGLLVAGATVISLRGPTRDADTLDAEVDPATYAMQATGSLADLAALTAVPAADLGSLSAQQDDALVALQQAVDEAMASLEAALDAAALPVVPDDYVPGADLDVVLPAAQAYPVPSLDLPTVPLEDLRLRDVAISGSPVAPRSGMPLEDVLGQLESVRAQIEGLVGPLPVEGLPVGPLPAPLQDADSTVDPDEEGAVVAALHAQSALAMTTAAYDATTSDLDAMLTLFEQLASQVQDAIDQVRQVQGDAEQAVDDLLAERLAAIDRQVRELETGAAALVAQHAQSVASAQTAAEQAIDQAAQESSDAVGLARDAAVRDLQAQAKAILADAEQRRADIDAILLGARAQLGGDQDAQQALQAVEAAASAAGLEVDRAAKAQAAEVLARVDSVADAADASQARIDRLARDALAQVGSTADAAVASDLEVRDYLADVAQAEGLLMKAREMDLAAEAVAEVQQMADDHVEELIDETVQRTQDAQDVLVHADDVVGQVEDLLVSEVGKDLDYVGKVGEDYGRVPTEERKARAAHWSGLAMGLGGMLDETLVGGSALSALADDALAAAQAAEVEVAALG